MAFDRPKLSRRVADWDGRNYTIFERNTQTFLELILKHLVHGRQAGTKTERPTGEQNILYAGIKRTI